MVGPLLLIIIGILFLLRNVYPQFGFHTMWPVILIVIGLAKVIEYLRGNPVSTNGGNPVSTDERKEGQ